MKTQIALAAFVSLISVGIALPSQADTVDARCDFYPIGEDYASSSVPCTFSQRQGYITIQTENASYDFSPTGGQPGNFVDANGSAVYRQSGLGDAGQIFRLRDESIYVYWDNSGTTESTSTTADYGETVPALADLVGARAGQAENQLEQRGYEWRNTSKSDDSSYANWTETNTGNCVTIRTTDGRYESIIYSPTADCDR